MSSKIAKALIMQFSQSSCYLLLLRPKYVLQYMLSNTLSLCSLLNARDQVSDPHKRRGKIMCSWVYFNVHDFRSEVKGNAFPVHAMKAYTGSRGIGLLIPNLDTRWKWMVNFTPQPLYPRETKLTALTKG
jgi:hypothetical protein